MDNNRFSALVQSYLSDRLTAEEGAELSRLLETASNQELLKELINNQLHEDVFTMDHPCDPSRERIQHALSLQIRAEADAGKATITHKRIAYLHKWGWVAAAVLIGVIMIIWLEEPTSVPSTTSGDIVMNDVVPGKSGAILTLADGTKLVLDSLQDGNIASQNGATIHLKQGHLSYTKSGKKPVEQQYNTIMTPKSRQFVVTLPDQSKLWLNAGSSVRYPTAFEAHHRNIYVTGEVYCEVAKNAAAPFTVHVEGKMEVEVLGTHFNINAYPDEQSINTTLLEGSVRIKQPLDLRAGTALIKDRVTVLTPGQQAQLRLATSVQDNHTMTLINHADTEKAIAWTKGTFDFDDLPLEEAMRQLARWYDIEVIYANGIPDFQFFGKIDRNVSLRELLNMLAGVKLKYRLESGRKLIILQ